MDDSDGQYQDWTLADQIAFNKNLIDEKVIICQWFVQGTFCDDPVKGGDLRAHLHDRHGITSDSQLYRCRWYECATIRGMRRSSLERHMKEQHVPVRWACPDCELTFTRESTLMDHMGRDHT